MTQTEKCFQGVLRWSWGSIWFHICHDVVDVLARERGWCGLGHRSVNAAQPMWRGSSVIAPCLQGSALRVSLWENVFFLFFFSVRDSPAEWWRDLANSSGGQGVEVGHVWSGVLPRHPYANNNSNDSRVVKSCRQEKKGISTEIFNWREKTVHVYCVRLTTWLPLTVVLFCPFAKFGFSSCNSMTVFVKKIYILKISAKHNCDVQL